MRITQKKFLKGWRTFELVDDSTLRLEWKLGRQLQERSIDLTGFESNPIHDRHSDIIALIVGILFALPAVFLFASLFWVDQGAIIAIFVFAFALAGISGFAIRQYSMRTYDVITFAHAYTGETFSFFVDEPNPTEFKEFVEELKKRIQKLQHTSVPPPRAPQSFSQELQSLAKLRDDGVLSEDEFNIAKKRILGEDSSAPLVGFRKE